MFTVALDMLEVEGSESLMVGDRATHDGAASEVGIDTFILLPREKFGVRGLKAVLRLVSPDSPGITKL